ncbi:helix-turn-helix domain-containing protein [Occallatibacter riparius]|uniref:Uncharacterized protein n=1 Tax=Occallatibacter riparius TaxID=1002689 RepID=A0A9J7BUG1_9BACT|nr:hypothetical protein [Occallatibacter riparius]UWZ84637.1 hypothetical protein MOP44_01580 [Occallatibacter riparius]
MTNRGDQEVSLRDQRKPCHFWVDNEVADCYQPLIGADATWVYCRIARYAHGAWIVSPKVRSGDTRVSLREMAEWCGKSVDTVWRCLQVLQHVGLIHAQGAVKSKGRYALADVKDLVSREGGAYDSGMGCLQLPVARAAALKVEVRELRARLARKTSGLSVVGGVSMANASVALSDRLEGSLFSVPGEKCDRSVAQSDKTVAPGATDDNVLRTQDCKTEKLPPAPSCCATGGDGGTASPDREIDDAVKRVMDAIGATARRLKRKIREQIGLRVDAGSGRAAEVADRMIAAQRKLEKNSHLLFKVPSAAEFYESGMWENSARWNWDQTAIREAQRAMEARAGSF